MPRKYDDMETDYFDEEVGSSFLSLMSLGVAFACVAIFIALTWYAYQDDDAPLSEDGLEVIYADETPIRVEPEAEDGWQYPDTERQVYNLGNGDVEDITVEQILPQPERPPVRESATSQTNQASQINQDNQEKAAEGWINSNANPEEIALTDAERRKLEMVKAAEEKKTIAAEIAAKVEREELALPTSKVVTSIEPADVELAPEVTVKAVEPKVKKVVKSEKAQMIKKVEDAYQALDQAPATSTKVTLTSNRLQLGAFSSKNEANAEWKKAKAKFSVLSDKQAHIERATVKGKTYFRVQAYPYSSNAQAKAMCVVLSSKGQPCFAVKK